MEWTELKTELPPEGEIVETKIDNENGCRNECNLYRQGRLFFQAPKSGGSMYIYYAPTHWRRIEDGNTGA